MRSSIWTAGIVFLLAVSPALAQGLGQYQYKSRSNISVGRGGYSDVTSPANRVPMARPGHSGKHHHHHGHGHHHHHHHGRHYYGYPYYGGYWGTGLSISLGYPAYGYHYYSTGIPWRPSTLGPYGTYYRPGDQYLEYYLPPTQPAELQYGPQAMKQFMGLPRDFAIQPQRNAALDAIAAPLPGTGQVTAKPQTNQIPQPSDQAIGRADHFIQAGDALFAQQRYQEALGRYKDAQAAAPGYAVAHLRKGLAYLATNRPDEAVKSLKLAVQQDPDIADAPLTLDQLLADNGLAKSSLLEANARRAVADPQNGDLLFAVGVLLYLDGDHAEAAKCFAAARQALGGGELPHIDAFETRLSTLPAVSGALDL